MAKETDKLSIFILLCVILFFFLGWRKSKQQTTEEQKLLSAYEIIEGQIVDCGVGKTSDFGHYSFVVKDKAYTKYFQLDKFCYQLSITSCDDLKQYKFPIAYSPENPNLNQMILSERDFSKYTVTRADSLSRVYKKYFDCR